MPVSVPVEVTRTPELWVHQDRLENYCGDDCLHLKPTDPRFFLLSNPCLKHNLFHIEQDLEHLSCILLPATVTEEISVYLGIFALHILKE